MLFDVLVFWVFAWDDGLLRGVLASYECDVATIWLEFFWFGWQVYCFDEVCAFLPA